MRQHLQKANTFSAFTTQRLRIHVLRSCTVDQQETMLTLVDGHNLLYDAFFATQDQGMTNTKGEPTGAVFTFTKRLLKYERQLPSSHFAVMMDCGGSQRRTQLLPSYKSHRACPSELSSQFRKAEEACRAFGVRFTSAYGYEADDLIATYAREASKSSSVRIISTDKDLLQLVTDRVKVHSPSNPANFFDRDAVRKRWGVWPEQLGDMLALIGDASDNIPGVPGIGPKKAMALLQRHGTLQSVLEAAQRGSVDVPGIGPKLVESLQVHEEQILKMREIVQLQSVPDVDAASFHSDFKVPPKTKRNLDRMRKFLMQENFRSLVGQVEDSFAESSSSKRRNHNPLHIQKTGGVSTVADVEQATRAMSTLRQYADTHTFAVSVEVAPVDGRDCVICFSIYGGEDLDFGSGPQLWVDVLSCHECPMWTIFGEFFENARFRKLYHNFSLAQRLLSDHVSLHSGLAGDTLQMARLCNPSIKSHDADGYSLELLSRKFLPLVLQKESVSQHFGPDFRRRRSVTELQLSEVRERWIDFTSFNAVIIYHLHEKLRKLLEKTTWELEGPQLTPANLRGKCMWDFYNTYYLPFGRLLGEIEDLGIGVDRERLERLISQASERCGELSSSFRDWAQARTERHHGRAKASEANLHSLNLSSTLQLRQLFFGRLDEPPKLCVGVKVDDAVHSSGNEVSVSTNAGGKQLVNEDLSHVDLEQRTVIDLKSMCRERNLKFSGTKPELVDRLLNTESSESRRLPKRGRAPSIRIYGLGIEPLKDYLTARIRQPQVSQEALEALKVQRADDLEDDGIHAVDMLLGLISMEALLNGFLLPLRDSLRDGRVHASLNLNTETGRLSCRKPNLQNQPLRGPLPIRDAFAAPQGQRLIVADYEQLELRLVAHLADCKAMIDVLNAGADIHSQTAYRMFDEVRVAVDCGQVSIDGCADGTSSIPPVKEHFPEQRRQAKTLNFALLYGKTSWGLSKDWGIEQSEAQRFIDKWFSAFPEVLDWKTHVEKSAKERGARSLLGRSRPLTRLQSDIKARRNNALRAAANTPVQGSAADVVMLAMLGLRESKLLQQLGYRQVLQVHDEILLEGPDENAAEALDEVVRIMEDPLDFPLKVQLKVRAGHFKTWHQAKI